MKEESNINSHWKIWKSENLTKIIKRRKRKRYVEGAIGDVYVEEVNKERINVSNKYQVDLRNYS